MNKRLIHASPARVSRRPLAIALSIAIAAMSHTVSAATINVTTADDPAGTSATCTLRQAIQAMNNTAINPSISNCVNSSTNAFGTSDTITFAATVTSVKLADLANNELLITDSALTITGSGMGGVTVSRISGATHPFRIFHDNGASGAPFQENLYLSGLTISNGATTAANAYGGAIYMQPQSYTSAHLKLTNCIVSGNSTTGNGAAGGAIGTIKATLAPARSGIEVTLTGSTISGNSTSGPNAGGGAIYAGGMTLKNSIVTGNSTAGNYSPGGGIQAFDVATSYSTVTHNSTIGKSSPGGGIGAVSTRYAFGTFSGNYNLISDNSTAGTQSPGGGVYTDKSGTGTGRLTRDIISNNSTTGSNSNGGGIYVGSYYGVSFDSSTISGNTATGTSSDGGGIWSRFGRGAVDGLTNSTVTGNTATLGGGVSANVCYGVSASSSALNVYNSTVAFNTSTASGGGIYIGNAGCPPTDSKKATSAPIIITSSILSNNSASSASESDIAVQTGFALTTNTSYALIANPPSTVVNKSAQKLVSLDPLLGPLANNGCGKMSGAPGAAECAPTLAIGCHSPAYNGGSNPLADSYDERGVGYPRGSGASGTLFAIGAYEDDDEIFCDGFELKGSVQ